MICSRSAAGGSVVLEESVCDGWVDWQPAASSAEPRPRGIGGGKAIVGALSEIMESPCPKPNRDVRRNARITGRLARVGTAKHGTGEAPVIRDYWSSVSSSA